MTDLNSPEAIRAGHEYIHDERDWARFDALDAGSAARARGEDYHRAADEFIELENQVARSAGYQDRFEAAEIEARIDAPADREGVDEDREIGS